MIVSVMVSMVVIVSMVMMVRRTLFECPVHDLVNDRHPIGPARIKQVENGKRGRGCHGGGGGKKVYIDNFVVVTGPHAARGIPLHPAVPHRLEPAVQIFSATIVAVAMPQVQIARHVVVHEHVDVIVVTHRVERS